MTLPVLPTKNLAPVKPLFALAGQNQTPSYISDALIELLKDILHKRDAEVWREVAETTEVVNNFIQGKQVFQPTTSGWRVQNLRRVDPNKITCINTMQFYASQNLQRIVSSNPDLEPAEEFRQKRYKEKVKRNAAVWNHYEKQFYTARFNHQEALHAIVSGTYIESVQYDHLKHGAKVFKEIWGEKEVPISEGFGQCFACAAQGRYEDFMPPSQKEGEVLTASQMPACPKCGGYEINVEQPANQLVPSVVALQPVQMGDLTLKLIPIQCVRFDLKKPVEESSYFVERFTMPLGKLRYFLGNNINIKDADITEDWGLRALDSIAKSGNTLLGQDSAYVPKYHETNEVVIDRLSLSPEDYAHIICKEEETIGGETIKQGQKLVELCPNGLTALFVNESVILGIYPDTHHSQEVSSGTFHSRLSSGLGRGSEDVVEVQKRFNRQDAQMVRAGETGATPAHWFVEGAVDRKHVKQIGMPGFAIPIKQAVVQALGKTDLVGQIPPANIAGTFFQYTYEILDKYRQMAAHAPDVTNNLTGGNRSGTATEAQISDSNAEALYSPMLQLKADVRRRIAGLTLQAYAKHFKGVSRYFSFGTTKQNLGVGEQLKGEDIDTSIEFVVVSESERPKTRYTQQNAFATVLTLLGGAQGVAMLKQTDPSLLDELLKTFDLELGIDDYDTIEDVCWKRLEQITKAAKEYEHITQGQLPLIPELMLLALNPQIRPTEPYHGEKMQWFSEYLDTPDGQALSETERDAVDVLIIAHRNGGVLQTGNLMQAQTQAQMIGQQPAVEHQQAMEQEAFGREMQGKEMDAQTQAQASEQDRAFQQQEADAQRDFEAMKMVNDQAFQADQSAQTAQLAREKIKASKGKAK